MKTLLTTEKLPSSIGCIERAGYNHLAVDNIYNLLALSILEKETNKETILKTNELLQKFSDLKLFDHPVFSSKVVAKARKMNALMHKTILKKNLARDLTAVAFTNLLKNYMKKETYITTITLISMVAKDRLADFEELNYIGFDQFQSQHAVSYSEFWPFAINPLLISPHKSALYTMIATLPAALQIKFYEAAKEKNIKEFEITDELLESVRQKQAVEQIQKNRLVQEADRMQERIRNNFSDFQREKNRNENRFY